MGDGARQRFFWRVPAAARVERMAHGAAARTKRRISAAFAFCSGVCGMEKESRCPARHRHSVRRVRGGGALFPRMERAAQWSVRGCWAACTACLSRAQW
ncbi:hypothetical protein J2W98_001692 [Paenibacillus peoriae]|uniref:Uncharacterized protein n=1 Tax=Paenibacillus peoriae TaxID=59893 RepID=A0ABU1QCT2_9BACL|nr:hypothetical protein [Paenibacillus peoriae]